VSVCPVVPSDVMPCDVELAGLELLGGAGMVAVRAGDLRSPARVGLGKDGRTAVVAAGAGRIRTGDVVVFFKPVVVAKAVVRRDGRVQACGHPADYARLGVLEEQLEGMVGPGVVDELAKTVRLNGKVTGRARRVMTTAFVLRAVLLMTLMPEADYTEVLTALLGDLAAVPWQRPYRVPSPTVLSRWRAAIGAEPTERLQQMVLAAAHAEHQDHDLRAVFVGQLRVGAIDGSVTRMPDTPGNRGEFGSVGTKDDTAPYPQLRHLLISDASTRATLGVVSGPAGGDKAEAEQKLLDAALEDYPHLFTEDWVWVLDRNFPGVPRIARMLATGTHVLIRIKSDIPLKHIGGFAEDRSYLAEISGGGLTLTIRVVEYWVDVAGQDTPELFCLITDLRDEAAYPAEVLATAYRWRWDGSETALREAKSAITGAGPSTGPIFRSHTPDLIRQEHAAWTTATELVRAVGRTAARNTAPAAKGRRAGQPVHPREISFTTTRRTAIGTIRHGHATASLPRPVITANYHTALATIGKHRVQVDRNRHRDHKTKTRQPFPNAPRSITTRTATAQINICGVPAA
jgi:Insertion element 4 transposase N-terminal